MEAVLDLALLGKPLPAIAGVVGSDGEFTSRDRPDASPGAFGAAPGRLPLK